LSRSDSRDAGRPHRIGALSHVVFVDPPSRPLRTVVRAPALQRTGVPNDDTLDAPTADGSTADGTRRSTGDTQKMG